MGRRFPYRKIAGALILIVVSVSLMNITGKPEEGLSFWESFFNKAALPVHSLYRAAWLRQQEFFLLFKDKKDLMEENEELRKERDALYELKSEFEELVRANKRLTALLDIKTAHEDEYKVAKVIGREPSKWFATVTIDLGSRDGVSLGASVVEPGGLVGRVFKVGDTSSVVLLLTDPDSGVGAILQRSRDHGLILGGSGSNDLVLRLFSKDADVSEGDTVTTSGMGSKYPAGIVVGKVESVYMPPPGLVKEAIVRPAADFDHLEEVMVAVGS